MRYRKLNTITLEHLNIMYERAFSLGCILDGAIGWKYLAIAARIAVWRCQKLKTL